MAAKLSPGTAGICDGGGGRAANGRGGTDDGGGARGDVPALPPPLLPLLPLVVGTTGNRGMRDPISAFVVVGEAA